MKNINYLILFFGIILLSSCTNCNIQKDKDQFQELKNRSIFEIAVSKYGKKNKIINNKSNLYGLCIGYNTKQKAKVINKKKFFIFDLKKHRIIFEDSIINGTVSWKNENIIVVTRIPGMIKKDNEANANVLYYYDVIKGRKINK